MTSGALDQRRIALLGFGVENRALGHFLLARDIPFSVCDAHPPTEDVLAEWPQVQRWHTGPSYLDELSHYDLLFRTPGLSALHPRLLQATARGADVSSQMQLFFSCCPSTLLGVTGTKGKGTTTTLLAALLGADPAQRVFVGGNIGQPPIAFLDQLGQGDLVLLELSSFQLQDLTQSPHLALVLSVTQDHLDYHAHRDEYVDAKRNIARYQQPADLLITHADCPTARTFADCSPARHWSFSSRAPVESGAWIADDRLCVRLPGQPSVEICHTHALRLPGRHNAENACAAIAAAAALGVEPASMQEPLADFRGLPHRLEYLGERAGIAYYNDSLGTTPDAAIAALRALERPVALIAGGAGKGADFAELGRAIAAAAMRGVLLLGEEALRLERALAAAGYAGPLRHCTSMEEAVEWARMWTRDGDAVLLSPACASFDMFVDYRQRGECFREASGFAAS